MDGVLSRSCVQNRQTAAVLDQGLHAFVGNAREPVARPSSSPVAAVSRGFIHRSLPASATSCPTFFALYPKSVLHCAFTHSLYAFAS